MNYVWRLEMVEATPFPTPAADTFESLWDIWKGMGRRVVGPGVNRGTGLCS